MANNKCVVKYVVIKNELFAYVKEIQICATGLQQVIEHLNKEEKGRQWYLIEVKTAEKVQETTKPKNNDKIVGRIGKS